MLVRVSVGQTRLNSLQSRPIYAEAPCFTALSSSSVYGWRELSEMRPNLMLELALVGPEAASGGRLGGGRSGHEPLSVRADVGGPPRVADRLPTSMCQDPSDLSFWPLGLQFSNLQGRREDVYSRECVWISHSSSWEILICLRIQMKSSESTATPFKK